MYYSASIFAALGFKNATAVGLVIATVNFMFTLVALRVCYFSHFFPRHGSEGLVEGIC
jgi:hypothetical protein